MFDKGVELLVVETVDNLGGGLHQQARAVLQHHIRKIF